MAEKTEPAAAAASGLAGEMELEAYRRLSEARPTTVALGAVSSAHGSALVRLGDTVMLPTPLPCFPLRAGLARSATA